MSTVSESPRRRGRGLRVLLGTLAALLALVLIAVGGYVWHLRSTLNNNVQHQSLLPQGEAQSLVVPQDAQGNLIDPAGRVLQDDQGQPIDASTMHIDGQGRVVDEENRPMLVLNGKALPELQKGQPGEYLMGVKSNALAQPKRSANAGNSLNFLVIGADKSQGGASRSDVIVVAHVSGDRKRVDLIHVPRDLYVSIPGHGKNKINASYAYGDSQLLIQTLQPLIGVPVDHVAKIDFDGFQNMTDALGGVTINTDEGQRTMNGSEALKWVRERKTLSQGDISRGQRQMQFIRAVLVKGLSKETLSNPKEVSRFLDAGTKNMVVDDALTTNTMQSIALSMRNVRGNNIKMHTAPWTGVGTGPYGMSIVTMSEPQMKVLADHLANDKMDSYVDDVSPKSGFGR